MKNLSLCITLLIISVLSCKKKTSNSSESASGTPATVYPCPAPNFTNVINPNGQRLIKEYIVRNNGNSRYTGIYYYDSQGRVVSVKGWDTSYYSGWTYSCSENQYIYGANGKVSVLHQYEMGKSAPTHTTNYFYNSASQSTMEVRSKLYYNMVINDTIWYTYQPGVIERFYMPNNKIIYYLNSSNNLDSVWSNSGTSYFSYDGKANPYQVICSNIAPFAETQNQLYVWDNLWGTTVTYSYTYNANNLPVVCTMSYIVSGNSQKTYYFYE